MTPNKSQKDGPLLFGPDGKPLPISEEKGVKGSPEKQAGKPARTRPQKTESPLKRVLKALRRPKEMSLAAIAVVAFLLAIYAVRPVFSVQSIGPRNPGAANPQLVVQLAGMPITDVSVHCITQKVIMGNKYTLELRNYADLDRYDLQNLSTEEPFTVNCPLAWTLLMGTTGGFFVLGAPVPNRTLLGFGFRLGGDLPVAIDQGRPKAVTIHDLLAYTPYYATAIDGIVEIRYRWRYTPFRQTKRIRVLGDGLNHPFIWKVAPVSAPPIKDSGDESGFKCILDSEEYGVTTGGNPDTP